MLEGKKEWNRLTERILKACFEVHRRLGAGLLESVYEECLAVEMSELGLNFEQQKPIGAAYKGIKLPEAFRLDFLVENLVILELKSVERLHPVHEAQTLSYLTLAGKPIGLLVNFHAPRLRDGIKRYINT